jgi:hypothetical protein
VQYMVGFGLVLALVASPVVVSAKAGAEASTSEVESKKTGEAQETKSRSMRPDWYWCSEGFDCPEPSKTEVSPERPVSELHESGIEVTPRAAPTVEDLEQRVLRARHGLILSSVIAAAGAAATGAGAAGARNADDIDSAIGLAALASFGALLMVGGIVGIGISGGRLSTARREQRERLREAQHGGPRRVQWDLARSRLMF